MRKIILTTICFLFLVSSALCAEFWASKNSNKYHYPDCVWAQKIKPYNLMKFNTPEEATKAGYIPCKVCKPPVSSKSETKKQGTTLFVISNNDIVQK
jgi:methylphosphotriester-DNA--protein-cysteine methyltransferase